MLPFIISGLKTTQRKKSCKHSYKISEITPRHVHTSNFLEGTATLGSTRYEHTAEYNALSYTRLVKSHFKRNPAKYKEFVRILSDVAKPESNKVDLVKSVIALFDGQPQLVKGFAFFLPSDMSLEVQSDAFVVNVHEETGVELSGAMDPLQHDSDDADNLRYIRNVEWTFMHQPQTYRSFLEILQNFNRKSIDEKQAALQIAKLFRNQRDLILGFNIYFDEGFAIIEDERRGFMLKQPCKTSGRSHLTRLDPEDVA